MVKYLETDIEKEACSEICKLGAYAHKLAVNGVRGFPDRTIMLPGARTLYMEFKQPGKKADPLQRVWREHLEGLGFEWFLVESVEQAVQIVKERI